MQLPSRAPAASSVGGGGGREGADEKGRAPREADFSTRTWQEKAPLAAVGWPGRSKRGLRAGRAARKSEVWSRLQDGRRRLEGGKGKRVCVSRLLRPCVIVHAGFVLYFGYRGAFTKRKGDTTGEKEPPPEAAGWGETGLAGQERRRPP